MLVCFDLDGTIIDDTEFIWYTLHDYFGVPLQEVKRWHKMYLEGKITYDEWFAQDILWWNQAGARKHHFFEALKRLSLMPGAQAAIHELHKRGHILGIISGSLNIVVDHFFPEHLFSYVYVNSIFFDHKGRISGRETTPYDNEHKATALHMVADKEKLAMKNTVFVGDNYNDIEALRLAGTGIAFNAKSKAVEAAADVVVKKKDLREVLIHIN